MLMRCFLITPLRQQGIGSRLCYDNIATAGRLSCSDVIEKYLFNILHPTCSSGCQKRLTIGSSPDPLSLCEGLASETSQKPSTSQKLMLHLCNCQWTSIHIYNTDDVVSPSSAIKQNCSLTLKWHH